MANIFGVLSLVLALFSVVALVNPKTPLGNLVRKFTFLSNASFNKAHKLYSITLFNLTLGLVFVFSYFILIYFSFFTIQKIVFNVLYMGCLSFVILIILNIRSTKIFEFEKMFLKFFFPFLTFVLILIVMYSILETKFQSGELNKVYTEFKADKRITLVPLDSLNAVELRDYFSYEYKLNSGMILLNEFRNAYRFKIDLKNPIKSEIQDINRIQKECSLIYNEFKFDEEFLGRIDEQVAYINQRDIGKVINIFPPKIQANFISSSLVYNYSREFSTLAKGSKMYLTKGYLKLLDNLGKIGVWVSFILIPLISVSLTKRIDEYNSKYETHNTDGHNLFFMFVSVIGFIISVLSLF